MRSNWTDSAATARADLAACRAHLRGGSRSFFAASLLLPRRVRAPATVLYAFCRLVDDAIDRDGGGAAELARLADRIDRIYAGRPLPIAADRALSGVVDAFAIPRALLEALLEGVAWDAEGRRYEDLADLRAYAARVAGAVGAMMALLMGVRSGDAVARACDLGVAMQLTNIARDVGEDARAGRLYLPRQWMHDAGIDLDAFLGDPRFTPALGSVVRRLLAEADAFYARADSGIAQLPRSCQPGIRAARALYAGIGSEVERMGFDSVSRRAVVPPGRKLGLLASALTATLPRLSQPMPAAPETRFLVAAVLATPAPQPAAAEVEQRVVWLVELFDRLERREQAGRRAGA
jgi:phytoene synthase